MQNSKLKQIITIQMIIIVILIYVANINSPPFLTVGIEGANGQELILKVCHEEIHIKGDTIINSWDECEGSVMLLNSQREILITGIGYTTGSMRNIIIFQKENDVFKVTTKWQLGY